ncbi:MULTISPECIES: helix-turn-helix domain-containing protein [Dyella]|uniref:AraC family transcriptional regulator n=2 Tax=Dyella TaxID=231454 RepID=A0A4V2NL83_9GAMM|nr:MULTISPECIES: AraC family transcriptional regulator [Dyella]TBR37166.1 AraC family transcriptional regulator [Dyella terrae]TCI07744.1 AraC family transcriptional regulator [Dyella soli]
MQSKSALARTSSPETWPSWPASTPQVGARTRVDLPHRAWLASPAPQDVATPGAEAELQGQIRAYIRAYLTSTCLDSSTLQRTFRISRRLLYRLFDDVGGVARYIREQRLDAAYARLIANPDCSITRLLYDLGFTSDRQFQRSFRARYGMSPLELKQRQGERS